MQPLFHSLRRDWESWSRAERIVALGLLTAMPVVLVLALITLTA